MKSAIVFTFVVLACLCLQAKAECIPDPAEGCGKLTCHKDGSRSLIGCGTYQCAPGKQIDYREDDNSKPYPECCGGPVCAP